MKYKINYNGGSKSPSSGSIKIKVLNFNVYNFRDDNWKTGRETEKNRSFKEQMRFIADFRL